MHMQSVHKLEKILKHSFVFLCCLSVCLQNSCLVQQYFFFFSPCLYILISEKILKSVVEKRRSALNNLFNFCLQMGKHLQKTAHEQNQVEMG